MSKRVESVYLSDMLKYGQRVLERLGSATREELGRDLSLQESVVFNLIVIGEAVSKVSPSTRAATPEIAWTEISDMRNRLVHGYFEIDVGKVWKAATEDIPDLIATLEQLLSR